MKIVLVLISLMSLILLAHKFFIVRNIECYTQFGTCPARFTAIFPTLKNLSLISLLPTAKVQKSLLRYPEIKSVHLYRRLPKTLIVSVTLRRPLGAVGPSVLGAGSLPFKP